MLEVAVAGGDEFLLGFRLVGVRNTFKLENEIEKNVNRIMEMEKIGVLVLDEAIMTNLPDHIQDDLNKSVKPVVVSLSAEGEDSSLRDKIIRAIGVDLWKG